MTLTGQFEVAATSEAGFDFTNSQSTEVAHTFTANGTWSSDVANPYLECTAEGLASLHPLIRDGLLKGWPDMANYLKYPKNAIYGLVAQSLTTGEVTDIGKKATLVVKPGETLRFVMNDLFWGYANNKGSIFVSWSALNLVSKVMQFDGDRDYINLPAMNVNYSGGLTLEAWLLYDTFEKEKILINLSKGFVRDEIRLANEQTTGNLVFHTITEIPSAVASIKSWTALDLGKWMHVAATIDASGNGKLYKNGQEIGSGSLVLPNTVERTKNCIGTGVFRALTYNSDFKGKMAEIRLWNRDRTQAEIQADMSKRLTGKEPGLAAYWPLNEVRVEGSALKVADITGNFPGTVIGAVLVEDTTFPVR
jgi:hypothetical protein